MGPTKGTADPSRTKRQPRLDPYRAPAAADTPGPIRRTAQNRTNLGGRRSTHPFPPKDRAMTIKSSPPTQSSTKHKLTIQQCLSCATLLAPSVAECSRCHENHLAQVESDGFGFIVSSKVVEREVDRSPDVLAPQTIAIVELDDGPGCTHGWPVLCHRCQMAESGSNSPPRQLESNCQFLRHSFSVTSWGHLDFDVRAYALHRQTGHV